jgi:hypothetical protein
MARRCWKHSRQKTGRPCVGRNGTVVSFPHCEQLVLVSERMGLPFAPPEDSARLALQALQRLGSFLKPLSAKNICSPAVNTNSALHSEHFRTLSWYSMEAFPPETQTRKGTCRILHEGWNTKKLCSGGPGWAPGACERKSATYDCNFRSLPDLGLNHGAGRRALVRTVDRFVALSTLAAERSFLLSPVLAAASCADASAKALPWPGASRRVSCRSYAS